MHEFLYRFPTPVIAAALFAAMAATIEATYRLGARRRASADRAFVEHVNAVQAALLGVLALLLGFTFSLALQRLDSRSEAVGNEANAIGTAWLRSQFLAPPLDAEAQALLRAYVDLRVKEGHVSMVDRERPGLVADAARTQDALWLLARKAVRDDPDEVRTGLFVEALNDTFDAFGNRENALRRHVPEVVVLLMFATFLMVCISIGYAAGIAGYRTSLVTYVMVALIVLLVFLIIDIDRPRRGLVVIDHRALVDLQAGMRASPPALPAR